MVYTIDDIKARVIPIAKRYNLQAVYLFGSYARGEADDNSDIDLAIEPSDETSYFDAYCDLKDSFQIPVDVLSMENLLNPYGHVAQLVKQNFLKERLPVYEG